MKLGTGWLLIIVAGIVPAFAIGYWWDVNREPEPGELDQSIQAPPEPEVVEPEIVPVFPNLELGPRPVGTWDWKDLRGGECVDPFEDPFAEQFVVVDCEGAHQAELSRLVLIDDSRDTPYPGDEAIGSLAEDHCSEWDLTALNQPERYDDLLVVASYSLGEDAWGRGDRLMGCFVYRESELPLADRLVSE